ncbi:heparinase [Bacillus aerolatus]|uniref:Heparinase n=1 Tax=Bacillus aerolatus TaxID=2653354 RepID=A0A6I1FM03_9BACI|nr:alginate lyase family protein [Bacillus aerolatus]KAB7707379.1 heparinase [Bacillus aerolatus]
MKDKLEIIRNMGLDWTAFRIKYELEKKLGLLQKQFPAFSYSEIDLSTNLTETRDLTALLQESRKRYFFSATPSGYKDMKEVFQLDQAIAEADDICEHKFRYFSQHLFSYDELEWHYNPANKNSAPADQHWAAIADLGSDFGDIKWIWELSRFLFVYPLVRAYAVAGEDKYVETFWAYFEDFIDKNPPELGPNYKCGQEMSLRLMAWTFGLFAFLDHPFTTENRIELMLKAIYHHADHVEKHFSFALKSVKNNHSLSEAAGMYTAGMLFPYFDKAEKWRKKGKKYIQSEAMWQIYEDGSYIQHSMNYQRLAIQGLTWVLRLGQINNDLFEESFVQRFRQTILFMYQHQELPSGRLPNYGMNDGAYIHPLTSCEYLDHRPALQAAWYVTNGELLYKEESVSEIVYWLSGDNALAAPASNLNQQSSSFEKGGYYTIRNEESFGMIRCTTYKHRPAQADMLHFDLWHKGKNILADAGTFSYNTDMDHILYFNGTASHNTVTINNQDQMKKASRFIWLNWTKSKALAFSQRLQYQLFEGEHSGYGEITHRRGILESGDQWIVVDDLFGKFSNDKVSLSWLFGVQNVEKFSDNEWRVSIDSTEQWKLTTYCTQSFSSGLYKGSERPLKGWRSLYYGYKEPFPQAVLECGADQSLRFVTVIGAAEAKHFVSLDNGKVTIGELEVNLNKIGGDNIFNMK